MLAPIVLFVYNRPEHTRRTLEALKKNDLASESQLFIYADGAKENASDADLSSINEVRKIIRSDSWCKDIIIYESDHNKGLADSIVRGVSDIVGKYGKVIVLEDDIVSSIGFLKYMNDALSVFENSPKVMSVSAFMFPINDAGIPDVFCYDANSCWGWATWKDKWKCFEPDIQVVYDKLERNNVDWRKFNAFQHNAFQEQIMNNLNGKIKTWAVKWHAAIFLNGGTVLHPRKSLVRNIGFDGSGEHCDGNSVYVDMDVADYISVKPSKRLYNKVANERLKKYFNAPADHLYPAKRLVRTILRRMKSK